jgi:hypothetical protein
MTWILDNSSVLILNLAWNKCPTLQLSSFLINIILRKIDIVDAKTVRIEWVYSNGI